MKEFLVNHWNLPDNCSVDGVPATKEVVGQKTLPTSIQHILTSQFEHRVMRPVSFSILDGKGQVEVFHYEGTNSLTQEKESKNYHDNTI
jgi:hypothetical protein